MTAENDRKRLTFAQAEGVEPLPSQLKPKEISQELRAKLWGVFHSSLQTCSSRDNCFVDPWAGILRDKHVLLDHNMVDDFNNNTVALSKSVRAIFEFGDYIKLLGFVEWVLRHPRKPHRLEEGVEWALRASRAAYTVVDSDTIAPIGSGAERVTLERAFADVAAAEFNGARAHLRNAASELTAGHFADSIRESIHAVESVARVLEPSANTLAPALGKLERAIGIHRSLKHGFINLYGFTSDEKGVRHALLDDGAAKVDETDAIYMLGACAAFASYLINKARTAKLLGNGA